MAAVHFVITIPTEQEEYRLRENCLPENQKPCNIASPSTRLISNSSNSNNICTVNLFASEGQYGTFSAKREPEVGNVLGADIIVNEANSASTLDIEVNQPAMQKPWEGLRDLLSSARWSTHKKKDDTHSLNLPPDACMEIVLRELLEIFQIDNAVWTLDKKEQKIQITFTIDFNEKYEKILDKLIEWRIGDRKGSTVSVMNCMTFMASSRENDDGNNLSEQNINLQKESAWDRFMNSVRSRLNVAQIVRDVRQEASITFDFIILVVSAAILASFGLVEDSSIFLAASMLISPLMGPIIAAIFGTVIKDQSLRAMGLANELLGILIATFVGFVFGLVVCSIDNRYGVGEGLTNEMLSRCELHSLIVGIFTALASGAAAAVGILGGNIGSLVGVAISASILPPAVNSGLLWALAFLYKFYETDSTQYNSVVKTKLYSDYQATELVILGLISMCLTISNVICVYLMGIIVLKIKEIAPVISRNNQQFWKHDIKVARDLNKNGYAADATIVDDFLALPKQDQEAVHLNCDCCRIKYLEKSSYQNTWSPSSTNHQFKVPHSYCTVSHLDTFYSNLARGLTNTTKHKSKLDIIRRQKSMSVDLGHYQLLTENISRRDINNSRIERRRKNFIVTPASDQLNCPDEKK